tara:strand:- start:101 stop:1066 length:966 start_codon:yes stop_codon:yes gene_type:complete
MTISTPITGFDPDNLQGATVRPPAAQKAAYRIDYRGPYPDSCPFRHTMVTGTNDNPSKTRDNHVHRMGFNIRENGTQEDTNAASVFMSFEEHYHPSFFANPVFEWHLEGQGSDQTTFRAVSFLGEIGDVANTLSGGFQAAKCGFSDFGGTQRFWMDFVTPLYGMALAGNNFFDITADNQVGSNNSGTFRFYPYSATNAGMAMRFYSSDFVMGEINAGVPIAKMRFGPGALGATTGALTVAKGSGGQAVFGFGVDVGTGQTDGDLHVLDGATINISGTTTGLTIGGAGDKLGFFGKAPVVQQSASDLAGVIAALKAVGILSA